MEHCFHYGKMGLLTCCVCGSSRPFTACPGGTMGIYLCHLCGKATSTGEVLLPFASGNRFLVPDLILHYVIVHDFQPPDPFVNDVLNGHVDSGSGLRGEGEPVRVGWLTPGGEFSTWDRPQDRDDFAVWLERLLRHASSLGLRVQTRGIRAKPQ